MALDTCEAYIDIRASEPILDNQTLEDKAREKGSDLNLDTVDGLCYRIPLQIHVTCREY
jgi:hypothetical protein